MSSSTEAMDTSGGSPAVAGAAASIAESTCLSALRAEFETRDETVKQKIMLKEVIYLNFSNTFPNTLGIRHAQRQYQRAGVDRVWLLHAASLRSFLSYVITIYKLFLTWSTQSIELIRVGFN